MEEDVCGDGPFGGGGGVEPDATADHAECSADGCGEEVEGEDADFGGQAFESGGGDGGGGDDGGGGEDGDGVGEFLRPLDTADEVADDDVGEEGGEGEEADSPEGDEFSKDDTPAGEFGEEEDFVISLFDFLRHEEEASEGHEEAADPHGDPPEGAEGSEVPHHRMGGTAAAGHAEFELGEDGGGGEEVDEQEGIDEAGAAQALAKFLDGHGIETIRQIDVGGGGQEIFQGRMSA